MAIRPCPLLEVKVRPKVHRYGWMTRMRLAFRPSLPEPHAHHLEANENCTRHCICLMQFPLALRRRSGSSYHFCSLWCFLGLTFIFFCGHGRIAMMTQAVRRGFDRDHPRRGGASTALPGGAVSSSRCFRIFSVGLGDCRYVTRRAYSFLGRRACLQKGRD